MNRTKYLALVSLAALAAASMTACKQPAPNTAENTAAPAENAAPAASNEAPSNATNAMSGSNTATNATNSPS
jgi:hypothetical protein